MKHLLLISLGPVQDFIASARRCQDLWFGSWLLSDLARVTAEEVRKSTHEEEPLIFPAGIDEDDKPAVANKILAILPDGVRPNVVADAAKEAMEKRLGVVATVSFERIKGPFFHRELAERQIDDLVELIWVAVPFEVENHYATARNQAESLLAARKNTRNWGPVPWHHLAGEGVPKSSLDGIRESAIHEDAYNELRSKPEQLRKQYFVKKGERLCGVGLLKRLGTEPDFDKDGKLFRGRRPVFHSTSHIASLPLLTRIERAKGHGRTTVHEYFKALEELGVDINRFSISRGVIKSSSIQNPLEPDQPAIEVPLTFQTKDNRSLDGYLFFEGRLPELLNDYCPSARQALDKQKTKKQARKALASFRKSLGLRENHTTYYAYLLADGDNMGKAIDVALHAP